jgi:hypothetical protein
MKKLRVNRVDSHNGETRFILEEIQASERSELLTDFDMAEIKRISRKQAAKPLVLIRGE